MVRKCLYKDPISQKNCTAPAAASYLFCAEHRAVFNDKTNKELLSEITQHFRACVDVSSDRKIVPKMDRKAWAWFTNTFNELTNRRYSKEEVMSSISELTKSMGTMDDINKILGLKSQSEKKWKSFEKLVESLHKFKMSKDVSVSYDEKIIGIETQSQRQVDVCLRFNVQFYTFFIAIECKDYKGPVSIEKVEAFHSKLHDIGAHKGVMVARNGFQAGAVAKAKSKNIDLFTLEEIHSEWNQTLREFTLTFPMPDSITFGYSERFEPDVYKNLGQIKLHEVMVTYGGGPRRRLGEIVSDICMFAHNTKLALPANVMVQFDQTLQILIPGDYPSIEVKELSIQLTQYHYRKTHSIDLPPRLVEYRYTDILRKKAYDIDISELGVDESMN